MNTNKSTLYIYQRTRQKPLLLIFWILILLIAGCKKFVTIDAPKNQLIDAVVFNNEATVNASVSGIYQGMVNVNSFYYGQAALNQCTGLSCDELNDYSGLFLQYNENGLIPTDPGVARLWSESYKYIYTANSIIEGLEKSPIDTTIKNAYTAEAKFLRAFYYFYIVNLFGDVPLVLQTDYNTNKLIGRTVKQTVYAQIIRDLHDAEMNLRDDYSIGKGERVRPNKASATALLARVYLFAKDYEKATLAASSVIDNSLYVIDSSLNNVFLANSGEAILQFIPESGYTYDANIFLLSAYPSYFALTNDLISSFEVNDKRRINWVGEINVDGTDYFYAKKYKNPSEANYSEYNSMLRLAEQYLIRAEANIESNNLSDGIADLNVIRKRAGLPDLDNALIKEELLAAVEKERRSELFTEGHRWFDLKRTTGFADQTKSRADEVLSALKGDLWQSTDVVYPIPQTEVVTGMLGQNPGYE